MLGFFSEPYNEELLYSTLARYHFYSGNVDSRDTFIDAFGNDNVIPTISFPSRLKFLEKQLKINKSYTADYFLRKHTLYPFYEPFLPKERQRKLVHEMKFGDGKGICASIGLVAGGLCEKDSLQYCPICVKEDAEKYGEGYFYRTHQLQGIFICSKHKCYLYSYPVNRNKTSRIEFIRLDYSNINYNFIIENDTNLLEHFIRITEATEYILANDLKAFNQNLIHQKYRDLLEKKGLLTVNGFIKHDELFYAFKSFYGDTILDKLESNIRLDDESNWLKSIVRKPRKVFHPIRNILFILFLCRSVEEFFINEIEKYKPFGSGPWPCLNPASEHYRMMQIKNCTITADYKTRVPVATFKCDCGFSYSRKGPDKDIEDKYKIGTIKSYGKVWEDRLKQLIKEGKYSIRQVALIMRCDSKTIKKYTTKVQGNNAKDSNTNEKYLDKKIREIYRKDVVNFISSNQGCNRKYLREKLKKQFIWLYRHDKKWLYEKLPLKANRNSNTRLRVDWEERDKILLNETQKVYSELILLEKPKRITLSLISKRLGKEALLDKYINKLPLTKSYIDSILENVEKFQIRRLKQICNKFIDIGYMPKKWELVRKAGLRKKYALKLDDFIESLLSKA